MLSFVLERPSCNPASAAQLILAAPEGCQEPLCGAACQLDLCFLKLAHLQHGQGLAGCAAMRQHVNMHGGCSCCQTVYLRSLGATGHDGHNNVAL